MKKLILLLLLLPSNIKTGRFWVKLEDGTTFPGPRPSWEKQQAQPPKPSTPTPTNRVTHQYSSESNAKTLKQLKEKPRNCC